MNLCYIILEALIFFRLLPSNCLNWKIYCINDHSSLSSAAAVQNVNFICISHIILCRTCIRFNKMLQTRKYCLMTTRSVASLQPLTLVPQFSLFTKHFFLSKKNQFSTIPYLDQFYYSPSSPELPGDQKYDCFGYRQIEEHCEA